MTKFLTRFPRAQFPRSVPEKDRAHLVISVRLAHGMRYEVSGECDGESAALIYAQAQDALSGIDGCWHDLRSQYELDGVVAAICAKCHKRVLVRRSM